MADIIVSVAEFKAKLSQILTDSRVFGRSVVILNRKIPIATVVPFTDDRMPILSGGGGLASLAGAWSDLAEISVEIDSAYNSRSDGLFREVSF